MSSVTKIYKLFMHNLFKIGNYTGEKYAHVYNDFWSLLISSGFRFNDDDLIKLSKWCEKDSWRNWYGPGEGHYNLAIFESNLSFATAYEKYKKRIPFIGKDLDFYDAKSETGCITTHCTQNKSQGRLCIRTKFLWKGEKVTVTNFKDENHSLIACAYQSEHQIAESTCDKCGNTKYSYPKTKIKRRFTISIDEWREENKKTKEVKQLSEK